MDPVSKTVFPQGFQGVIYNMHIIAYIYMYVYIYIYVPTLSCDSLLDPLAAMNLAFDCLAFEKIA